MGLNTTTILLKCLEYCQNGITKTSGLPTRAINETISNINFIRNTVLGVLGNPYDVFNALKNSAASFSVICGLGADIESEQTATQGYADDGDLVVNDRQNDRYAFFMTISSTVIGGDIGRYSGISRGEIVELDGDVVPEVLGKSLITNMLEIVDDFSVTSLGGVPDDQVSNAVLIINVFKFLILGNICRIAIRTGFSSQEIILEYINKIAETFDNFLDYLSEQAANGSVAISIGSSAVQVDNGRIYEKTEKYKNVIITELLALVSDLAISYNYEVPNDVNNVLTLAYDKYGDLDRAFEIYFRNKDKTNHPGFLPSGQEIRILSE